MIAALIVVLEGFTSTSLTNYTAKSELQYLREAAGHG
jgi:hypothetical protein